MEGRGVCLRCAQIKQACDGAKPCSRCRRLDVPCEVNTGDVSTSATHRVRPVKITRTQTGCQSCKKRKRKCDEARPKCADCRRLCFECVYPESTPPRRRKPSKPSSTIEKDPVSLRRASNDEQSSTTVFENDSAPEDLAVLAGLDEREGPVVWDPEDGLDETSYDHSTGESPASSLSLSMISAVPSLVSEQDKSLLNHYVKVVAIVLSRRNDHRINPYLANVVPLAISNRLVMDALLALSASHWKKMHPSLWKRGIVHQTSALRGLSKLLPQIDNESVDGGLLATLLLAMVDLYDGNSSTWSTHLLGVRQLLSAFHARFDTASSQHRTFLKQLYHYLDSATTISTCQPPLLEASQDERKSGPYHCIDDEEALYGIPRQLFHFVDKVNGLAYQRRFREDPVFESMFQASAASLRVEIDEFMAERCPETPPAHLKPGSQEIDSYHATRAFGHSLRLRLHQVVNGYSLESDTVKSCVRSIIESIQEIHYGSPLDSSLIFPLVMCGGACDTEHDRLVIADRFTVMEKTLGFRYVYTSHELVQRVWKDRDLYRGTGREINWAAIRYYDIPGLALV